MDWFGKAIEILKLPLKYIWAIVIASGLLVFLPQPWLNKIHLDHLSQDYSTSIGAVFLISSVLLLVTIVVGSWNWIIGKIHSKKWTKARLAAIHNLDLQEKSVLREFFLQNQSTLSLPVDQATVAGLIEKGVLRVVGSMGERSLAGSLFPVSINSQIKNHLTFKMIDLPENHPSEVEKQFLLDNRPDFIHEVNRHMELFHRSFR